VLGHTASPSTIRINQSATLTGSFLLRNDTTAVPGGAANLDEIIGLPITFQNPVLGTIPQAQPETILATGTATATFNAGGVGGAGHADAIVDQQTVAANIVILQPLQITKSFNPTTVAVNATSTLSFAIANPNTIAVDANFADTFPSNLVAGNFIDKVGTRVGYAVALIIWTSASIGHSLAGFAAVTGALHQFAAGLASGLRHIPGLGSAHWVSSMADLSGAVIGFACGDYGHPGREAGHDVAKQIGR